jgi:hypothetical protein
MRNLIQKPLLFCFVKIHTEIVLCYTLTNHVRLILLGAVIMLLEYIAIAVFIALTTLVAIIAITLGTLFGPKRPAGKKSMPYESGMNPIGPGI